MAGPSAATMVAAQDASAAHGSLPGIASWRSGGPGYQPEARGALEGAWTRLSTFNIYKLLTKIYKLKKFRCQGIRSGETLNPDTRDLRPSNPPSSCLHQSS